MIKFTYTTPTVNNRNRLCPMDLFALENAETLRVNQGSYVTRLQTMICPRCGRRYISTRRFEDLMVVGIGEKDYINLNLPEGTIRPYPWEFLPSSQWEIQPPPTLETQIRDLLSDHEPLYPKRIANRLRREREEVYKCLCDHPDLFFKDDMRCWWLRKFSFKWTHDKIYYLTKYVPQKYWTYREQNEIKDSRLILDFKDGKDYAINEVAERMLAAIKEFMESCVSTENVLIISVPPSKKWKPRPMAAVCQWVAAMCGKEGDTVDAAMFERMYDVKAAHESFHRPEYEEQKASIYCRWPQYCTSEYSCIILDDITTTGTIMNVCRDILLENGMPYDNIVRFAFSKTNG